MILRGVDFNHKEILQNAHTYTHTQNRNRNRNRNKNRKKLTSAISAPIEEALSLCELVEDLQSKK